MITEALLAAALAFTGGAAINDSPQNIHEGISGCAAYESPLEQRACVGRVHYAWTGESLSDRHAPTQDERATAPTGKPAGLRADGKPLSPGAVAPINTDQPVPVVSGNATWDGGEWTAPEWCATTKDAGYSGPIDHESGLDWEEVTAEWTNEQVEQCF